MRIYDSAPLTPLTEEDSRIWRRQAGYAYNSLFFSSRYQDRRDAELMFALTDVRSRMVFPVQSLAMLVVNGCITIEKNGVSVVGSLRI